MLRQILYRTAALAVLLGAPTAAWSQELASAPLTNAAVSDDITLVVVRVTS